MVFLSFNLVFWDFGVEMFLVKINKIFKNQEKCLGEPCLKENEHITTYYKRITIICMSCECNNIKVGLARNRK